MPFRWSAELEVRTRSSFFTLGPGRTLPLVDRTLLLDENGIPMIPASTIRGRCRAHLERLLAAWGHPVCSPPDPQHTCPHNPAVWERLPEGESFCLACRIFGSPWRESAVQFSDLHVTRTEDTEDAATLVDERVGTGINRRLGTVEEKRLYFSETTPPGRPLSFSGRVEGFLEEDELGWLVAALLSIAHLGGGKARGLGRVEVRPTRLVRLREDGSEEAMEVDALLRRACRDDSGAGVS